MTFLLFQFICFFFFNDTATTEIYTLSLHDALPICRPGSPKHEEDHDRDLTDEQRSEDDKAPERGAPELPDMRRELDRQDIGIEGIHQGLSVGMTTVAVVTAAPAPATRWCHSRRDRRRRTCRRGDWRAASLRTIPLIAAQPC